MPLDISQGAKVGVTLCSTSFLVGGNWGYLSDSHKDYTTLLNLLQEDRQMVSLIKVSNGVIVQCNPTFLIETIKEVESSIDMNKVIKLSKERKSEEKQKCLKFLESIVKKSTKYGESYEGFTEYNIGIYSANDLSKIRLNGLEYPAFKITVMEMLEYLRMMLRFCVVYVKVDIEGVVQFIEVGKITSNEELEYVTRALEISATQTGVFITIRVED